VLTRAAKGRHFAMYFRDSRLQTAFERRGLAGDLSDTDHDYIGVFTQNTNASKADYWQKRTVDSDVELQADGSAKVTLTVTVDNAGPPFTPPWAGGEVAPPEEDPTWGYFTRWNKPALAVFLPRGAEADVAGQLDGLEFDPKTRKVLERAYFYRTLKLPPNQQGVMTVSYTVPNAAVVDGDSLVYLLDIDPQAMVNSEGVKVTLHVPEGYGPTATPEGWQLVDGRTLVFDTSGSDEAKRLEVDLARL
jgi:hypothetical protein